MTSRHLTVLGFSVLGLALLAGCTAEAQQPTSSVSGLTETVTLVGTGSFEGANMSLAMRPRAAASEAPARGMLSRGSEKLELSCAVSASIEAEFAMVELACDSVATAADEGCHLILLGAIQDGAMTFDASKLECGRGSLAEKAARILTGTGGPPDIDAGFHYVAGGNPTKDALAIVARGVDASSDFLGKYAAGSETDRLAKVTEVALKVLPGGRLKVDVDRVRDPSGVGGEFLSGPEVQVTAGGGLRSVEELRTEMASGLRIAP